MNYVNLAHVKASFIEGKLDLQKSIAIVDRVYKRVGSVSNLIEDMSAKTKFTIVFESDKEMLLCVWAIDAKQRLVPADVLSITKETSSVVEAIDPNDPNIIGDTVQIKFSSLPGTPVLKGKVDTGADISSLHADKWAVQGNRVQFVCSKLSPNAITVPLRDQQAVKSASGVQYRPVIELSIKINDKVMNNMLFNIADRGNMDYPVLVGQNILEKGKFLINPSLREQENQTVDSAFVTEQVATVTVPDTHNKKVEEVYKLLKNTDVKFSDLLKHVHTEVTKTFEDVKY